MSQDILRYDLMVQDALKGVVRKILIEAGRDGLPGEHHFYVTFRTTAPGVRVSQRLRDKHPDEMTIVLQHQFWDLNVSDHAFEVGLSFSGVPERLLIPFDALTTFFDPSVQFGLKFETQEPQDDAAASGSGPGQTKPPRGAGSEPAVLPPAALALPVKVVPAGLPAIKGNMNERRTSEAEKASGAKAPERKLPEIGGKPAGKPTKAADAQDGEDGAGAQVVSLDSFRKKT